MVHAATNPPVPLGNPEAAARVFMLAKRALDRHKAVAHKSVAQAAGLSPCGGGNGEALDALRKRNDLPRIASVLKPITVLPIGIEYIPVTQIGNARAANPP